MNLPLAIAWRYVKRPTDRLVSAAGLASIAGLVIGVMALVISMALMTGYRLDLERKLLGGNAEIFLYSFGGQIDDLDKMLVTIRSLEGVSEASPVIFQHGLIASEEMPTGEQVMLKGIEPSRAARSEMLAKVIGSGMLRAQDRTPSVALGRYLAKRLRVAKGSVVTVTVPTRNGRGFLPRSATFVVSNVFETGFHEFDSSWMFLDLAEAQRLFEMRGGANLIEINLHHGASLDAVAAAIGKRVDHSYAVTTWKQMNRQLFSLLEMQQIVLFIVLGLIVFVSTFNIVSTLVMTVHEKRQEIGILASMGATQSLIRRIFVSYGVLVGFTGTATGIVLGVAVCWVLTRFKLVSFGPEIAEVYFVSSIPFITKARDLAVIAGFSISVSFLASLLPSMRAARLTPIEALRHE